MVVIFLFPEKYFIQLSVPLIFHKKISMVLFYEFTQSIGKIASPGLSFLLVRLFYCIVYSNFLGLFPYVFTATRHLVVTVRLILPLWLGYSLFYIIKNVNSFLSHLVPSGTPYPLIPFIVVIELIRNVIRPLTLSVRLAANIIAGHMLIALVRSPLVRISGIFFLITFIILLALLVLELAVSIIQSYVFRTLLSLYIIEANSPNF